MEHRPSLDPAVAQTRRAVRAALADIRPGAVVVALSGGADSLALAAATAFEAPKRGMTLISATIDHGLQPGSRLLDVGSAHGWFLEAASECGLKAQGVEPDEAVAADSVVQDVRVGFFPDVLEPDEQFDAITYNDVFEHLPDVDSTMQASVDHLAPGGLLSVNIPNSRGLFYRIAVLCHRVGVPAAFRRLWQVGLPSPHLWYFDSDGLGALGEKKGLELVATLPLDSVRRQGLWQRAHADRSPSPSSVLGVVGVWLLAPLFNRPRTSDIMHLIFRKPTAS